MPRKSTTSKSAASASASAPTTFTQETVDQGLVYLVTTRQHDEVYKTLTNSHTCGLEKIVNERNESLIEIAIKNKDPRMIRLLRSKCTLIVNWGSNRRHPIFSAIDTMCAGTLLALLDCADPYFDLFEIDSFGNTPLIYLISQYHSSPYIKSMVDVIVEVGKKYTRSCINLKNHLGQTALIMAATQAPISVVETLIKANADLNLQDNQGYTALFASAINPNKEVFLYLLSQDTIDVLKTNFTGDTALMMTANFLDHECVAAVFNKNATNLNAKNICGDTALIIAARAKNQLAYHALIKCGADETIKDGSGMTASEIMNNNTNMNMTAILNYSAERERGYYSQYDGGAASSSTVVVGDDESGRLSGTLQDERDPKRRRLE